MTSESLSKSFDFSSSQLFLLLVLADGLMVSEIFDNTNHTLYDLDWAQN